MTALDVSSAGTGEILGERYRLDEKIGEGGMSRVYRAEDLALQRTVAVKVMRAASEGATARERARSETTLLAALTHPSLVTMYDAHIAVDEPSYLVMEYIDGRTLRDRLDAGPLPPDLVAALGTDLAEALHAVHDHGVVHRDIKPSNVLLWASPLPDRAFRAKLTDFGIACLLDAARVAEPGTIIGPAAYLAPEQVRGEDPAPAADIYSLGLVLLEALTAQPAFGAAAGYESVVARLTVAPSIPDEVPDGWRELLIAMTAANPARRPTALQVAVACGELRDPARSTREQLRTLLAPQPAGEPGARAALAQETGSGILPASSDSHTAPLPVVAEPRIPRRGRRIGALATVGALVVAGVLAVGFAVGPGGPPPVAPDVGQWLGAQLGERAGEVTPVADPVAPEAGTGSAVGVVDSGTADEAPGNENRGPGNNSGSGADANSGNGNGNGKSGGGGNGNGNGGKGGNGKGGG
jgi:tRNA A-37 threonylcarbamoyl transferase component Bud32/uncharacterized membrane protein YgcG